MTMTPKVVLAASELAAAINWSAFKTPGQVAAKLLKMSCKYVKRQQSNRYTICKLHQQYMANGIRDEPVALGLYAKQTDAQLVIGKDWPSKLIHGNVHVKGRCDAIHADGSTVVEVKCRQLRVLPTMPLTDKTQLYAYMFLSGARHGRLCQYYNGLLITENLEWEDAFWQEIRHRVDVFAKTFHL
jgi:hypothetical protein